MDIRTGIIKILLALGFLFNINQAEKIKLLKPADGEKVNSLFEYSIKWEGQFAKDVKIEYTLDGGINWIEIITGNWLIFNQYWFPPDTISSKCKIRITDITDSTNYDENEDFFTLYKVSYDFISINNCFMWIGNNGMGSHNPISDDSGFYWNGGEDPLIASIFSDGLVWGGKINGEIRVNGNTYRHGLIPGRIIQTNQPDSLFNPKNKIFKIRKNWEQLPEGSEKERRQYDYENWPGELGAPFNDIDNDGIYTNGIDEPNFIGDEVLFYVANDLDSITSFFTYGSPPIGLEFQTTVWGFDTDDFLKDVVFKNYKIINKSENTIEEMYISYWTDDDLGFAGDDLVGCDTNLSLGYTYNGDNDDEDNYRINPPAVGHLLLSISGNNISVNNASKKLSSFININKGSQIPNDPAIGKYDIGTLEYYNLMQGLDNLGGPILDPITRDTTKFMVAGNLFDSTGWYDIREPQDSRYTMTAGPFNMDPGDTIEVVYTIFMARGSSNLQSIVELKNTAESIHLFYGNEILVDVRKENNLTPTQFSLSQNYPNPFNPTTTIKYSIPSSSVMLNSFQHLNNSEIPNQVRDDNANVELTVYDILGRKVKTLVNQKQMPGNYEVEFNANKLASGMYFYRLNVSDNVAVKKMMLLK